MLAMVVNDDAGNQMPLGALRFFASMLAPIGGGLALLLWVEVVQGPVQRQLTQHDHLGNPQQRVALRALQERREVIGHDTGRGKGFAGVGQRGSGVDVGGDDEHRAVGGEPYAGWSTRERKPGRAEALPRTARH